MIDRRTFVCAVAATIAVAAPATTIAQQAKRVYRVAVLRSTAARAANDRVNTENFTLAALAKLGYTAGHNLILETRFGDSDPIRLSALAAELVQTRVDIIVAIGHGAVVAAKKASSTIPIIIFGNFDPVARGYVASLARPGGNVTGVLIAPDGTLGAKKLELLKETVPKARRIAVLAPEDPAALREQLPELTQAAKVLAVELPVVEIRNDDYAEAMARVAAMRSDALYVIANAYFTFARKPIIELAAKYRLPSMWEWREQVEDGALMAYGSSLAERAQRVAEHIDRILKGRSPGELPVDRPMSFELSVNVKTAKALGVTFPPSIMVRADKVIE